MSEPTSGASEQGEHALLISREFAAPRELVFKVYTERQHLDRWWGPSGFTMVSSSIDLRPGGAFHYCMRAPDGQEMWGKLVFREIVPPERLAFVVSFADAAGNTVRAPFNAHWPLEILNIATFTEHDGRTTLTLRGSALNATIEERDTFVAGSESVRQGLGVSLDQLGAYLATLHV